MTTRDSYSAKQLARVMGITPRQLRKFFRTRTSSDKPVGRGGRYDFPAEEVDRIKEEYRYWRFRIEEKERERKSAP